ncbi:Hypothetical_protein [Hexamita inflata]|uniref:Hypothetical_protein n=1 Tax=Hexamita inflata TaxID=28002 RepID=A0AA86R9M1_9EUKA|nr:Hypothetical protein HINF_LOCUS57551 [Hexamita inflata]
MLPKKLQCKKYVELCYLGILKQIESNQYQKQIFLVFLVLLDCSFINSSKIGCDVTFRLAILVDLISVKQFCFCGSVAWISSCQTILTEQFAALLARIGFDKVNEVSDQMKSAKCSIYKYSSPRQSRFLVSAPEISDFEVSAALRRLCLNGTRVLSRTGRISTFHTRIKYQVKDQSYRIKYGVNLIYSIEIQFISKYNFQIFQLTITDMLFLICYFFVLFKNITQNFMKNLTKLK